MSRGPASFKRRDVTSAVLGAASGWMRDGWCGVGSGDAQGPGTYPCNDKNSPTNQEVEVDENEWDAWVAEKHNKPPAK